MEIPNTMNIFCRWCKKHTAHTVENVKKHKKRSMCIGERRFQKKLKGYGSFPKPMPEGKKPTQRQDLRYKCSECGKSDTRAKSYRVKKFQITTE